MKLHRSTSRSFFATALAGTFLTFSSADKLHAQTPKPTAPAAAPAVDPATYAARLAASGADAEKGDLSLAQQLAQLQAKIAQLEASLAKNMPPMAAGAPMPGMPAAAPPMSMGMGKMKPGAAMPGMSAGAAPGPAMAGMSSGAAMLGMSGPPMNMMGMMDKMMGMMDKMMGMGGGAPMPAGGAMPGGGGMGMMDMDMMKMGAMPAPPVAGGMANMSGGGMMGMMGMGGGNMAAVLQSALPGFPGASHLYHLGATGFFLDHLQHIALTTEQQAGLNKAKEQALLAKGTADRAKEQAEQELWTLTAADQPDAAKIEAKLAEIGKLSSDERLAFIRAVGDASKLLTDEQRKALTGFAPPAPAPAVAPMAPMKGM